MASDTQVSSISIDEMALLFDRLASGEKVDRTRILRVMQLAREHASAFPPSLIIQNASSFVGALADQPSWLMCQKTRCQCRWFAGALREGSAQARAEVTDTLIIGAATSPYDE